MTTQITLEAEVRQEQGKEKMKRIRKQDLIPAVFYGKGFKNINLVIKHRPFIASLKKSEARLNSLFNMKIKDGDKVTEEFVLIRQFQRDAITDRFMHLDFMKVNIKEAIHTKVRIKLVGECPAIKLGLALAQNLHELPIKCLPLDIPVVIEIDITKMEKAHDAVRVGDIKSDKFTIELPAGQQIIHAEIPRELKVEETVVEATAEVPTTVQGQAEAAEGGEAKEGGPKIKPDGKDAKGGDAKAADAKGGKPEAKADTKGGKPDAKGGDKK